MPCRSDWPEDNYEAINLRKELDKVTRLLCETITALYDSGVYMDIIRTNSEVEKWFIEHQEADRIREIREKEIKSKEYDRKMRDLRAMAKKLGVTINET